MVVEYISYYILIVSNYTWKHYYTWILNIKIVFAYMECFHYLSLHSTKNLSILITFFFVNFYKTLFSWNSSHNLCFNSEKRTSFSHWFSHCFIDEKICQRNFYNNKLFSIFTSNGMNIRMWKIGCFFSFFVVVRAFSSQKHFHEYTIAKKYFRKYVWHSVS